MRGFALYLAALALIGVSAAHSYLGERYLLMRLFRRSEQLPKLFGSTLYTQRTLRFAWHVTSIAWLGYAALLVRVAQGPLPTPVLGLVVGAVFALHFAIVLWGSRGRHYAWVVFLVVAVLAVAATWSSPAAAITPPPRHTSPS